MLDLLLAEIQPTDVLHSQLPEDYKPFWMITLPEGGLCPSYLG